jgi:hypothetical protein
MQVSKGLKRATGRGEQVQHHLGTLNFDIHFEFSMAASPKISRLDAARVPGLGSGALPSSKEIARTAKLDFAANPNRYRANGRTSVGKAKPRAARGMDLSPRLVLGLSVECETAQILDPPFEE